MIKEEIESYRKDSSTKTIAPVLIALSFIIGIGIGALLLSVFSSKASSDSQNPASTGTISDYVNEPYLENILKIFNERYLHELPSKGQDNFA